VRSRNGIDQHFRTGGWGEPVAGADQHRGGHVNLGDAVEQVHQAH
jgi:hypothetical protein